MKKLLALMLALVTALTLVACGSKEDTAALEGAWRSSVDVSEEVSAAIMGELTEDAPAVDGTLPVYMSFTVAKDGAYTLALDYEATAASLREYCKALSPVLVELLYAQAEDEGTSREKYDKALEQLGLTAEEYVEAALEALDIESLLADITENGAVIASGVCRAAEGKLYLADTADALESAGYIAYTLEGDTMTWTDEDGAVTEALTEGGQSLLTLPLTWSQG